MTQDNQRKPGPPPILDYRPPELDRQGAFKAQLGEGVVGFVIYVAGSLVFGIAGVAISPFLGVFIHIAVLSFVAWWAIQSRRRSGTYGFLAGFFIAFGVAVVILGVTCAIVIANL